MPTYSDRTDEGPLDFPRCPSCGEIIYSEAGCTDCLDIPPDGDAA